MLKNSNLNAGLSIPCKQIKRSEITLINKEISTLSASLLENILVRKSVAGSGVETIKVAQDF